MKKWEAAYIADVITLEDLKAKKAEIGARRTSAEQEQQNLGNVRRNHCAPIRSAAPSVNVEEEGYTPPRSQAMRPLTSPWRAEALTP
jgi:hypothetical protein